MARGLKIFFQALIRFYQYALSPFLGQRCRFYPSCSHYALQALECHPWYLALLKITWRLLRCGPWSEGGEDFPCTQHKDCLGDSKRLEESVLLSNKR